MQGLQYKTMTDTSQQFHTYMDVTIINNDQKNGEPSPQIKYVESRNIPYLKNPSQYFFSIVRFSLDTTTLPVFIPQVEIGQTNPNKLIYQFYMLNTVTNAHFTQNVEYIPNNTALTVVAPTDFQDLSNEYYFVYSYQNWVKMLNATLTTIASAGGIDAPFFYYDVNTSLLKLYTPLSWGNTYKLYINNQLQSLMDSFQYINEYVTPFNKKLYRFDIYNNNYKNVETLNAVQYLVSDQELCTLSVLNPVSSVVFCGSLFPIAPTLTSAPKIFGADSAKSLNEQANLSNIITDLEVETSNGTGYKEMLQYTPTVYRLFDLVGYSPLTSMEISVFWKDRFGNLHPLKLASGCSCTIKMMFRLKSFDLLE